MFKLTSLMLFTVAVSIGDGLILPSLNIQHFDEQSISKTDLATKWGQHVMDFINLIDINEAIMVAMKHIQDPEVQEFIKFIMSPKMTEIIKDFESIEEFVEAIEFLESKGYEAKYVINVANSFLKIPPLAKQITQFRRVKGIAGFIEDIMAMMPGKEMKELFESKLENSPEVADLFNTITSEEFVDIMKRMSKNPKFAQIKETLESYGFDTKFVCEIAKEVFGDYYQGIFCE